MDGQLTKFKKTDRIELLTMAQIEQNGAENPVVPHLPNQDTTATICYTR